MGRCRLEPTCLNATTIHSLLSKRKNEWINIKSTWFMKECNELKLESNESKLELNESKLESIE